MTRSPQPGANVAPLLLMVAIILLPSCSADTEAPHSAMMDSVARLRYEVDSLLDRHPDLTSAERSFMKDYLLFQEWIRENDTNVIERLRADMACRCMFDLYSCLPLIQSNPHSVMSGDDDCVLAVVDSLVARVAAGEEEAWRAFEALTITSDGYVSEHISSVVIDLFKENGEQLLDFLTRSDRSVQWNVEEVLIRSIQAEFEFSPEPLERGTLIQRRTADSILTALASSATSDAERDVVGRVRMGILPE